MASPLDRSHSRAVQSDDAVTRYAASTENTQSHTHLLWPGSSAVVSQATDRGHHCHAFRTCVRLFARNIVSSVLRHTQKHHAACM